MDVIFGLLMLLSCAWFVFYGAWIIVDACQGFPRLKGEMGLLKIKRDKNDE